MDRKEADVLRICLAARLEWKGEEEGRAYLEGDGVCGCAVAPGGVAYLMLENENEGRDDASLWLEE